jgi:hypothetical protein
MMSVIAVSALLQVSVVRPPDYTALVATVIAHMRQSTARPSVTGPTLVDIESFQDGARVIREHAFYKAEALRQASARHATIDEALVCTQAVSARASACHIIENGFFVTMDSVSRAGDTVSVVITTRWAERRTSGDVSTESRTVRLKLLPGAGGWRLIKQEVLRTT